MEIQQRSIWVVHLEKMKAFYERKLEGKADAIYVAGGGNFSSCTIHFPNGQTLELMHAPGLQSCENDSVAGEAQVVLKLESVAAVELFAQKLRRKDVPIEHEPDTTGAGRYAFTLLDPENNRIKVEAPDA